MVWDIHPQLQQKAERFCAHVDVLIARQSGCGCVIACVTAHGSHEFPSCGRLPSQRIRARKRTVAAMQVNSIASRQEARGDDATVQMHILSAQPISALEPMDNPRLLVRRSFLLPVDEKTAIGHTLGTNAGM